MPIDHAEVRRIARLAQLELDQANVEALTRDLERILGYVELLDELEVGDIPPASSVHELAPLLREDDPAAGSTVSPAEATANAPESAEGHFRVPRVLEG